MFKRFFFALSLLLAIAFNVQAQTWQMASVFPADSTMNNGIHGIAVDPDGKVWIQAYYAYGKDSIQVPGYDATTGALKTVKASVRALYVFNPDGTQASFSPILFNTVGGVAKDTLGGETTFKKILNPVGTDSITVPVWSANTGRGLTLDESGNVVAGYWDYLFKFDYKTGAGLMNRLVAGVGGVVKPGIDAAGNYYVRAVVGGGPLKIFDKDGVFSSNALDVTTGFARVCDVSKDGLTVYTPGYTTHYVEKLHRPDDLSLFVSSQILKGFDCESICWDPATAGKLWLSSGSYTDMPNRNPDVVTAYDTSAWYAFDTNTETLTGEKMDWVYYVDKNANERPRAIGFSPDGNTAYLGVFGGTTYPVRKYTKVAGSATVTFNCNMSDKMKNGEFSVGDKVYARGTFNGWAGTTDELTDTDGDSIYTYTLSSGITVGDTLQFKFVNNHGGADNWENLIPNRVLVVKEGTNVFSSFWETTNVFNCNMSDEIKAGNFSIGDKVWVRGAFNGWAGYDNELTDPDGDSVYTGVVTAGINVGASIEFKFVNNHGGTDNWESISNRSFTVRVGTNTFTAFWNVPFIPATAKEIQMAFSINMELEKLAGLFDATGGTVELRGDLFGWGPGKAMTASATNVDIYETIQPVMVSVGDKVSFKFWHNNPETWEQDNLTDNTQGNRYYVITQADYDNAAAVVEASFNNGSLETVLNVPANVKFTCNTNGRSIMDAPANTTFETVFIAGSNSPLQWPTGGWPNSDTSKVIFLSDDGTNGDAVAGDKIFTTTVTFPQYSVLKVKYKYGANWGLSTNGGKNDNEAASGSDKTLILGKFSANTTVVDTFGIIHTTDVTKVEKVGSTVPTAYLLEQNYPNPFNPETSIRFNVPKESFVTVKVFNTLGEEVATLVNEEKTAGVYNVSFKANNLTSGIYFYTIKANDFSSTKKMILMK
ncbi:MAG: T9SS type A sorting domain-containing protein [Ignavibacteriaceae bacterium]|jgi:hypothetical protein